MGENQICAMINRGIQQELARLRFLSRVSDIFTTRTEPQEAMRQFAEVLVPDVGDAASVDLLTGPDQLTRVAVVHGGADRLSELPTPWAPPCWRRRTYSGRWP